MSYIFRPIYKSSNDIFSISWEVMFNKITLDCLLNPQNSRHHSLQPFYNVIASWRSIIRVSLKCLMILLGPRKILRTRIAVLFCYLSYEKTIWISLNAYQHDQLSSLAKTRSVMSLNSIQFRRKMYRLINIVTTKFF